MPGHNDGTSDAPNKRPKDVREPSSAPDADKRLSPMMDDPALTKLILNQAELQTNTVAAKQLEPVELADTAIRGTSMRNDYVEGSHVAHPDERDRQQMDSLPRSLHVWAERLKLALKDLDSSPNGEENLSKLLDGYAKASKNLAKFMSVDQKRQLMEMAETATDALMKRQLASGDVQGAYNTLGAKLDVDANLTLNAPKPRHHLIKDLQKMVDLCTKYHLGDVWYWEDKLKQETN